MVFFYTYLIFFYQFSNEMLLHLYLKIIINFY